MMESKGRFEGFGQIETEQLNDNETKVITVGDISTKGKYRIYIQRILNTSKSKQNNEGKLEKFIGLKFQEMEILVREFRIKM
jgi:hypothetical protein